MANSSSLSQTQIQVKSNHESKNKVENNEFKKYTVELTVLTKLYAPNLSSVEFIKEREIQNLIECYKRNNNISNDDLELLKHMDRAFPRDLLCRPYLSVAPISGALKEIIPDAIVRGDPVFLPSDKIMIEAKVTPRYRMMAEYLEPVKMQFTAFAKLPKDFENKPINIKIGGGSAKGYGFSIITFKPEQ